MEKKTEDQEMFDSALFGVTQLLLGGKKLSRGSTKNLYYLK